MSDMVYASRCAAHILLESDLLGPGDVYGRILGCANVDLILDLRFILLIAVLVDHRSDSRVPHDKVVWSYPASRIHYGCLRKP